MEIITRPTDKVEIGSLSYGDVCQLVSGRIVMIVNGNTYIKDDGSVFNITIVDLEKGYVDRINNEAKVKPIRLVAKEV